MKVQGRDFRTVWVEAEARARMEEGGPLEVSMIDQRRLPHEFAVTTIPDHAAMAEAIRTMIVRGAPAIGAAGAYGMAQVYAEAERQRDREAFIEEGYQRLWQSRPTAQDLFFNLKEVRRAAEASGPERRAAAALDEAERLARDNAERCRRIGEHGAKLIRKHTRVMTHCNAGWLATVDWGTAISPIYVAHREGRTPHVLTSETRPRLQGANLTAWELGQEGIPYEIFADSASASLIRAGAVDLIITGADRIAANGDAANKIGTYEKALAAREHGVPFYIAAPASTFDLDCPSGADIPIEERSEEELLYTWGRNDAGELVRVRTAPEGARAKNPAFDVTPAKLITGLITEYGIIEPTTEAIARTLGAPAKR